MAHPVEGRRVPLSPKHQYPPDVNPLRQAAEVYRSGWAAQ